MDTDLWFAIVGPVPSSWASFSTGASWVHSRSKSVRQMCMDKVEHLLTAVVLYRPVPYHVPQGSALPASLRLVDVVHVIFCILT